MDFDKDVTTKKSVKVQDKKISEAINLLALIGGGYFAGKGSCNTLWSSSQATKNKKFYSI